MPQNIFCRNCKYGFGAPHKKNTCIWGEGKGEILFVLESPDKMAEVSNRPLVGELGRILQDILKQVGLKKEDVYVTTAVKCFPTKVGTSHKPNKTAIEKCKPYLIEEVLALAPKVTITLGANALLAVLGEVGLEEFRGRVIYKLPFGKVIPTYSLSATLYGNISPAMIQRDIQIALSILNGNVQVKEERPSNVNIIPQFERSETTESLILEHFNKAIRAGAVVSDVETTGLDWSNSNFQVTHYGACYSENEGIVFDPREYPEVYEKFLQLPQRVYNAGYEGNIYPQKLKFSPQQKFAGLNSSIDSDTQLKCWVANPKRMSYSLESQVNHHLGGRPWKGKEVTWIDWANRNAIDIVEQFRLDSCIEEKLTEKQRWLVKTILTPVYIIYSQLSKRGIKVNNKYRKELDMKLFHELLNLKIEMAKFGFVGNPESPQQIETFLYDKLKLPSGPQTPGGARSTGDEWLAEIFHLHPFVKLLRSHRTVSTNKSNFTADDSGWAKDWIYPNWFMTKLITGRPQPVDPTVVNVPRDLRFRELIEADDEDSELVSIDESQIELRIMAWLSKDPNMLNSYKTGIDIHRLTASKLFRCNYTEVTKDQRNYAKEFNFGLNYGASARTVDGAMKKNGVYWPFNEVEQGRNTYFKLYPGVADYHRKIYQQIILYGKITGPSGIEWTFEQYRLPQFRDRCCREGLNYHIQNLGAVFMMCGVIAAETIKPGSTRLTVHDQVVCNVKRGEGRDFSVTLRDEWKRNVARWFPEYDIPLVLDISIGRTLGTLVEMKELSC